MISISLKRILSSAAFALLLCSPLCVFAQAQSAGLSLSVTPTLFEMSANPAQEWSSTVKVINNNPYPITVYADVSNFAPQGETGQGKFVPVDPAIADGSTLAEWITIDREARTIEPEQSAELPFTVRVPNDATPGGHFAAILIGTKPPQESGKIQVSTSQVVTSLFFVRIAGDVKEDGRVREFRVMQNFVTTPHADFQVRFENKGNVHLQPQGEIDITNMWGKERGVIPINHETHFGNVLPESIRNFEFSWRGEQSFSDIGRYKAVLTLAYGDESRKFVTSTAYFYVVPVKPLLIVVGSLLFLIVLVTWSIKMYIRRMLILSGIEPGEYRREYASIRSYQREGDIRIGSRASVRAPITQGLTDFISHMRSEAALPARIASVWSFMIAYRAFFLIAVAFIVFALGATFFIVSASKEQRDYEVTINNAGVSTKLSSEEILHDKTATDTVPDEAQAARFTNGYPLVLVNSSDTPGEAARLERELEKEGYRIDGLESDLGEAKDRSVIVYDASLANDALALSKKLGNALLSARPEEATTSGITVYIGNDYTAAE
jgi:hypothetical protein